MKQIRITYIVIELILIGALIWAAANISFYGEDFESIFDASRVTSSFGIAFAIFASRFVRKEFDASYILLVVIGWAGIYNIEEYVFNDLAETASPATLQQSFYKVAALSTVPMDAGLVERLEFRIGVSKLDSGFLIKALDSKLKNRYLDVVERDYKARLDTRNPNSKINDPTAQYSDSVLIRNIEDDYINSLTKMADKHLKYHQASKYESNVKEYLDEMSGDTDDERISMKIWLWYLQLNNHVSASQLLRVQMALDSERFYKKVWLPKFQKEIGTNNIVADLDGFNKTGVSRKLGEQAYLLLLMTTLGIAIAFISLFLNLVSLCVKSRPLDK